MMRTNLQLETGFSLVETLVAITILLIVIVGPINLVVNSARSTSFANDQVVAFFLAQEGVELMHDARDRLALQAFEPGYSGDPSWERFTDTDSSGLFDECVSGRCSIYMDNSTGNPEAWRAPLVVSNCTADIDNCRLYIDNTANKRSRYTHESSGTTETKFTRYVTIEADSAIDQAKITATVTWRSDGQRAEQSIEAVTYLFDIYDR